MVNSVKYGQQYFMILAYLTLFYHISRYIMEFHALLGGKSPILEEFFSYYLVFKVEGYDIKH